MMTDFDLHWTTGELGFLSILTGSSVCTTIWTRTITELLAEMEEGLKLTIMHEDLDLNGRGIHEVLSFQSGNMLLHKNLDLNDKEVMENSQKVFEFRNDALQFLKPLGFPGMSVWLRDKWAVQQVTQTLGLNSIWAKTFGTPSTDLRGSNTFRVLRSGEGMGALSKPCTPKSTWSTRMVAAFRFTILPWTLESPFTQRRGGISSTSP